MSALVKFLSARIDEDEQRLDDIDHVQAPAGQMARARREIDAKRDRLARHAPVDDPLHGRLCSRCSVVQVGVYEAWPCPEVRDDAAVYADHPDYREAWRPQ
ncbi:DUF6221 family protein [Spirillospora sp. CA-253888]